jgi:two-component system, LytTR family, sensor kinase
MAIKQIETRNLKFFIWIIIPGITFLNLIIFGFCIFDSIGVLVKSFLISGIFTSLSGFLFDAVYGQVLKRFPLANDFFKRILYLLPLLYLLHCFLHPLLFFIYNHFQLLECPTRPNMVYWSIIYGCCVSTMITFFNLGVGNWESWKNSINETEKLKNIYQRSKIFGLKGQLNPHFLFNCFNILSGLIQEDEEKAEQFLDEMTKVHRYLLRSDDDLLVSLESELKFAKSYLYLANGRFGEAIKITIDIDKKLLEKYLPPLCMHVILENIIYTNAMDKSNPLTILIESENEGSIKITNSVHQKTVLQNLNVDDGLDNLINKYKMLKNEEILIQENDEIRTLILPLFDKKEEIL